MPSVEEERARQESDVIDALDRIERALALPAPADAGFHTLLQRTPSLLARVADRSLIAMVRAHLRLTGRRMPDVDETETPD